MACPVCDTKGLKEIDSRDTRIVTVVTYYQYKKVGSFHIISWKVNHFHSTISECHACD